MKIVIRRYGLDWIEASSGDDEKPHPDTTKQDVFRLDYRTVATIEEARKMRWFQDWYDGGFNHREDKERGMVVCDVKDTAWIMELNTLEEFVSFLKDVTKDGTEVIIGTTNYLNIDLTIDIG